MDGQFSFHIGSNSSSAVAVIAKKKSFKNLSLPTLFQNRKDFYHIVCLLARNGAAESSGKSLKPFQKK